MEKKDKKSGKHGRGLDTIGKRILVLTIAILMTFQFCTPTFYGISFADEEGYLEETEQPVDEQAVEPAETPEEEVQAEEPQGEATDPVLDEAVAEEPVDEVPADTVDEQEEPAAPEEGETAEPTAEEPAVEPAEEPQDEPAQDEPAQDEQPADEQPADAQPEDVQPAEEPQEPAEEEPAEVPFDDTASANGVTVHVTAEEGVLPEGASLNVRKVKGYDVSSTVDEALDTENAKFRAVEFAFEDAEGNAVDPQDTVTVNLTSTAFSADADLSVVDLDKAEEVTDATKEEDNSVTFTADGPMTLALAEEQQPVRGGDTKAGDQPETWTVTFYNRDAEEYAVVNVPKGETIGDQLPATIARDYYNAYWAIGEIIQGGQGPEISVTGDRIDDTFKPEADTIVVPDYDLITYSVTFHKEDGSVLVVKTSSYETNFGINEIPAVPEKEGYSGKWVYGENEDEFTNNVKISSDIDVYPSYDQNVFTVTYIVNGNTYNTDTYYAGDTLEHPKAPVVDGNEFVGWIDSDNVQHENGETVNSDLTLTAKFAGMYTVKFIVKDKDGNELESLTQYFTRTEGQTIGTIPQAPFVEGEKFEKWVFEGTDEEVTADTVVTGDITAVAKFEDLNVNTITAEYFYMQDEAHGGQKIVFETQIFDVDDKDLPYTFEVPASTKTSEENVTNGLVYYPTQPTVTVTPDMMEDGKCTVSVEYVDHTADYYFVYKLKDLEGDGYTEIEREHKEGVLGSQVTPTIKEYDYAKFESAETATITQEHDQELVVKYTRKNYTLSYESNGGSYVGGETVPYGSTVALSSTTPTRTGYTFQGWYSDPELTNQVTGSITVNADTVLYAKWDGNTVNYTIMYMKEQYNPDGENTWVYEGVRTASGKVGTEVLASSAQNYGGTLNGYERDTSRNGSEAAWEANGTKVTIAADGSTVLKVYYKLIRYTIVFNINNNYGEINIGGRTYTGNSYKIENVVIGEDIASRWPSSTEEIDSTYNWFGGWQGNGYTYITKQYILDYNAHVKNADNNHSITYTGSWDGTQSTVTAQYWLQQPDGSYKEDESIRQTIHYSSLGQKDINGYTQYGGTPDGYEPSYGTGTFSRHTGWGSGSYNRTTNPNFGSDTQYYKSGNYYYYRANWGDYDGSNLSYTYRFYYKRAQKDIIYKYNGTELRRIEDIFFEADISDKNYEPSKTEAGVDSDYIWDGWYADEKYGEKFNFENAKMPANDLVLYAKWNAPTFTVNFDMDGGTPAVASQTITKNGKVEKPENPAKAGYTFEGWYTEDGELFDWQTQITKDTTLYAHWTQNPISYTVHYVDENGSSLADDKVITDPNANVGDEVTEKAIAIAGYRPDEGSKKLTLALENNEITFVYGLKTGTTSYIIKYLIEGTEIPVAEEKHVTLTDNTLSVIELPAAVDYDTLYEDYPDLNGEKYYPVENEHELVLGADANSNIYTFYYSKFKSTKVIVNYVDMDGDAIDGLASVDKTLKVGETFTLNRAALTGWELDKAVVGEDYDGEEAGTAYKITDNGSLVFTLFYRKKVTVTATSHTQSYNGEILTMPAALKDQVIVDGLLEDDSLSSVNLNYGDNVQTAEGKQGRIDVGSVKVTPSDAVISGHTNPNYYKVRYIAGNLEVTKLNVLVAIEPDRWTGQIYDGTEKMTGFTNPTKHIFKESDTDKNWYISISNEKYQELYGEQIWETITRLDTVTEDASAAGLHYYVIAEKDAGDYPYDLGYTQAMLPVNDNFSVNLNVRPGRLQILKKDVTIESDTVTKPYDGTELVNGTTPLKTNEGWIEGEGVDVVFDGSRIEVGGTGEQENTFTYTAKEGTNLNNYNITAKYGDLIVTTTKLTITVKDKTTTYNGEEQYGYDDPITVTGLADGAKIETEEYVIEGLAEGQILTISGYTPSSGTNASTTAYDNGSFENATFTIMSGEGEGAVDVTNFYTIDEKTPGKLTIKPARVTLTAVSDTKTYNGSEQTISGFTPSVEGLTFEGVSASGSGITAGEYPVTFTGVTVNETKDTTGNYVVTGTTDGTLTITENNEAIVIASSTKSWTYDGQTHTDEVYTVTYGGENVEADSTGKVFTLPTGDTVTITATAEGVKDYSASYSKNNTYTYEISNATSYKNVTANVGTLSINKRTVTLTSQSGEKPYDGTPLTKPEVTVGGDGFVEGEATEIKATGSVTTVAEGEVTNTIVYTEGENFKADNYTITKTEGKLKITENNAGLVIASSTKSWTYDGQTHTDEVYTVTYGGENVEADSTGKVFTLPTGDTVTITATAEGVKDYNANYSENNTYDYVVSNASSYTNVTANVGTLSINKRTVTLTSQSGEKPYDGTPLTKPEVTVGGDGFVEGEATEIKATGSVTTVAEGEVTNTIVYTEGENFKADNYTITKTEGTLKITASEAALIIGSSTKSWTYDGQTHTDEVYTVTYDGQAATADESGKVFTLPTGDTVTITATAEGVKDYNANYSENNTYTYEISNPASYSDVTANVGTLSINKRTVTLTSQSGEKPYDGTPLTKPEVTVGGDGFVEGEATEIKATGSVTTVAEGEVTNTITYTEGENFKADNYTITKTEGTLKITASEAALIIGSSTKSWTYDGQTHTDEVYTVTYGGENVEADSTGKVFTLPTGDTVTITATAEGVKDYSADYSENNTYTYEISNATSYKNVTANVGTLSINKRTVTLTSQSGEKPYDGTPLTKPEVTVGGDGFVEGEATEIKATGSVTTVAEGEVTNTIVYTEGENFKADNYTITKTEGKLKITENNAGLVIASSTKSWTYDGQTHKDEVYTVTYGGENVEADSTGKVFTLPTGDTVTITATAEGVKDYSADYSENNTYTYEISNATSYKNVTANVGTLSINKRTVTLTSQSGEKPYDGTPLTKPEVTVGGDGFVEGEATEIKATGSVTTVAEGEVTNTIVYTEGENFKADNYTITKTEGKLKITENNAGLVIASSTKSWTYDGQTHTDEVYTVTYGGENVEADSTGKVFTLPTGDTVTITATAEGVKDYNANYSENNTYDYVVSNASSYTNVTANVGTLSINKRTVTLTSQSGEKPYDGTPLTKPEVTVGGDGFVEGEATEIKATGSVTTVAEGEVTNTIVYTEGENFKADNYTITKTEGKLKITENNAGLVIASSTKSWTYDGQTHTDEVYTVTYGGENVEADSTGKVFTLPTGDTVTITATAEGVKDYNANYSENNTYDYVVSNASSYTNVTANVGTLSINKRTVTLTSQSGEKPYDGTPLTKPEVTVGGDGFVEGEATEIKATGSVTTVAEGEVTNTIVYTEGENFKADNYTITKTEGTLKITASEAALIIGSSTKSWTYDGQTHTDEVYTVTYDGQAATADESGKVFTLPTGDTVTITATAEGVKDYNANYSENNTYDYVISNPASYSDVTANVGTLSINKRTVTLTSQSGEKPYDGTPLTKPEVTVGGDGFVEGEATEIKATGSVTTVAEGEVTNTIVYTEGENFKADNYTITKTEGKLKITENNAGLVIASSTKSWTYDGQTHTDEVYTVTYGGENVEADSTGKVFTLPTGDTVTITATAEGVKDYNANYSENNTYDYVVSNASSYTNVTANVGTLSINKRTVTLTSQSGEKPYDGTPLTKPEVTVGGDGFVEGEATEIKATGSVTTVAEGEVTNTIVYTEGENFKADNYTITKTEGKLKITENNAGLVIASSTKSWTYDGQTHTDEVYTVTYGGENVEADSTGKVFTLSTGDTVTITATAEGVKDYSADYSENNTYTYEISNATSYKNVTANVGTLSINKRTVTLTSQSGEKPYDGTPLTKPEVTVGGDGFVEGEATEIKATGSVTTVAEGEVTNTIVYTEGENFKADNYTITKTEGTLKITESTGELVISSSTKSWTYDGQTHKDEVYTVTYGGQAATADESGKVFTLSTGDTVTITATAEGVKDYSASYSENNTYTYEISNATSYKNVTANVGTLSINKRTVTLTSQSGEKPYDGTPLTKPEVTVGGDGFVEGEATEIKATGSVTTVAEGEVTNTIVYTEGENFKADNYTITKTEGKLKITENNAGLVIASSTKSWTYDGQTHTDEVYTVTYGGENVEADSTGKVFTLSTGDTVTITATAEGVKDYSADYSENNTYTYEISNATSYKNVTANVGTLSINKRTVTLTSQSGEKPYDGTPLTKPEVTVGGDGFVEGEATEIKATGSVTTVAEGEVTNTIVYTEGENFKADNYTITKTEGKLKITENNAGLVIASSTKSWTYDGQTHTDEVYTVTYDGKAATADESGKVFTLPTGDTVTITATAEGVKDYSADYSENNTYTYEISNATSYKNVTANVGTLSINKRTVTLTSQSGEKPYDGTALTKPEVTVGGDGFVEGEATEIKATGSVTTVAEGEVTNTIVYTEGENFKADNYTITKTEGTLKITESTGELVISSSTKSWTYDGQTHTDEVYTVTYGGQAATADESGKVFTLPTGDTVTITATAEGVKDYSASYSKNNTYTYDISNATSYKNVTANVGTLSINKRTVTLTSQSGEKPYDGTPLTKPTVTGWEQSGEAGFVTGEVSDVKATGSVTTVAEGEVTNTIVYTEGKNFNADNYTITKTEGTLKITEDNTGIVIGSSTKSWTYDGQTHTDEVYTVTYGGQTVEADESGKVFTLSTGDTVTITATAEGVKDYSADYNENNTYTYDISNATSYKNVTANVGTLSINKRTVTLTSQSGEKPYDGTPLTKPEVTVGGDGFVEGEATEIKATGSVTTVAEGEVTNTIVYIEGENFKADNYTITKTEGTLKITESTAELVISSSTKSWTYDGQTHKDEVYTVTYDGKAATADESGKVFTLSTGDTVTITATAEGVKDYSADYSENNTYTYVISNATSYKNVTANVGTLSINKAPVTIKTGSDSKEYDGTPLTKDEATITGLVNNETATVKATGSQTEVGSSDNTYSITWGTAKETNYRITKELGTLEVTASTAEVTLTAPSDEKTYDGTALTAPGTEAKPVTVSGLPAGFTYEASASGSQTNAGESANVVNDGYKFFDATGADKTANFTNVTKVDGTLTVNKAPVTIKTGSAEKPYDGTPLTEGTATIEGLVQGESVTLKATGTITEVGSTPNTYSITWDKALADNYTVTDKLGTLTITRNSATVTLTAATDSKTYDGKALTNAGVTADGLPEGFTTDAVASGSQKDAGESKNVVVEGFKIYNADGEDKTANFTNVTTVDGKLTVNPKDVTIKTGSASKAYDGTELTNAEATITGLVEGETYSLTATGTITEVGETPNTYSMIWAAEDNDYTAKESNYTVTDNLGTLTVTTSDAEIVLTAESDSKTYDGKALTNAGVTATGLPAGFTYEATASGSQTDAGESANVVNDGYKFFDKNGADKTANFTNVTKVDGKLTVNPKAVTITTGSDSKAYDGTALTKDEASIEGLVQGESVTLKATGSQTEVGSSSNTYSITWDKAKESNYTVTDNLGTLTVTKNGAAVTLTAPSDDKVYDGTALTAPGTEENPVTATGLPEGFTVEATATGSQTDAGESANVVNDGYKILNPAGEDRTENFTNVSKAAGTLTVTPKPVTIATGSDKKEYDGKALTNAEATITGLVEGETYKLEATGSQTEVGSSDNTYSMTWAAEGNDYTAKESNYTVTDDLGTLEVTKNTSKVTITAGSDDKTYDGQPLTSDQITAEGLPEGFTVTGTTEGSQTDAGKSDNTVTSYKILDPDGNDKTENFTNVTTVKGTLEVTPKAVKITTGSGEKEYDGQPLTVSDVTIEGIVAGETYKLETTGSQTEVGESDNTYSMTWAADGNDFTAKEANYTVTDEIGTLTVTVNTSTAITITAPSDSKMYDGKPLTCDGSDEENPVTATGLPEGFTVTGTADGSQTDAGTSDNTVTGYKILNAAGEDRTENFKNITLATGTLEVTKRPITLTSEGATKPYDGTPLEKKVVDISGEGLAECDDITYLPDAWGSQTLVGSSDNTFDYEFIRVTKKGVVANVLSALGILDEAGAAEIVGHEVNDIEKNYDVTVEFGTLEVTDKGADPDDVLTKTHEDKSYKVGETITFTIEVTNIYDEAKTITLEEMEGVTLKQSVFEDVEPGAVVTTTATYTVTEEDALAGTFTNTVKATYSGEDEPFDNDDTVDKFAHMTVTKTVTNKPADGEVFRTGETIKYEITVTNDGTQTLTDVVVKDELTGDEWKIDKLAAGKTKTFKAEYIVTEADGVSGSVTNVATATGNDPDGDDTPGVEGKVTTKTDKSNEPTVPKTGDNTPLVEFSVIFGASLITLLMMLFRRKNERA